MPQIHLANGEVLQLSDKEWKAAQEESGTPNAYHKDGKGSHVIGIYPDDYEYDQTDAEKDEAADRAEYEEWKRNRANIQPESEAVTDDHSVSHVVSHDDGQTYSEENV